MRKKTLLNIMFWFFTSALIAQISKTDSLIRRLETEKIDTNIAKIYSALCSIYTSDAHSDAISFGEKGIPFARSAGNPKILATSLIRLGEAYRAARDYKKAMSIFEEVIALPDLDGVKLRKAFAYNNIGEIYREQANYKEAISNYLKSLAIKEELNQMSSASNTLNNIGLVYLEKGDLDMAFMYFTKVSERRTKLGEEERLASSYTNIGFVFLQKGNYKLAKNFFQKAYEIDLKYDNLSDQATDLNTLGEICLEEKKYDEGENYFAKALLLSEQTDNKYAYAVVLLNLGKIHNLKNDRKKAMEYASRGLDSAKKIGTRMLEKEAYLLLSEVMAAANKYRVAHHYHKLYSQLKDSILNEENLKHMNEMQVKYESEKKEKELIKKDAEITRQNAMNERQKIFIYGGILGTLLMLIIAVISFFAYKQKKSANKIVSEQKKLVEEKQKEILDSIRYARRIQKSLLPTEKYITRTLKDTGKNK